MQVHLTEATTNWLAFLPKLLNVFTLSVQVLSLHCKHTLSTAKENHMTTTTPFFTTFFFSIKGALLMWPSYVKEPATPWLTFGVKHPSVWLEGWTLPFVSAPLNPIHLLCLFMAIQGPIFKWRHMILTTPAYTLVCTC